MSDFSDIMKRAVKTTMPNAATAASKTSFFPIENIIFTSFFNNTNQEFPALTMVATAVKPSPVPSAPANRSLDRRMPICPQTGSTPRRFADFACARCNNLR
jgi:hypothetical protein